MRCSIRATSALAALVILASCGDSDTEAPSITAGTDRCAPLEQPPVQAASHLIGDAEPPVPYSSRPPTSGWHASVVPAPGIYTADAPLREPQQVLFLELGGVVVTYAGLPDEDVAELEALVTEEGLDGQVALTPYDGLEEGEVAAATWGGLQVCEGVDIPALRTFAMTFANFDASDHA